MWRHLDVSEIDSLLYDSFEVGSERQRVARIKHIVSFF